MIAFSHLTAIRLQPHLLCASKHSKMFSSLLFVVVGVLSLLIHQTGAISTYWTPIIPAFCSPKVSPNVTASLLKCDQLMDGQLAGIFDGCVRSVLRLKEEQLNRPKLCYYARSGAQLDRCKMAKYRSEGITLTELVDREQEHTWCLMQIAEPLKWERLCSSNPADVAFNMARMNAIQACESRFAVVTKPIKDCFREEVASSLGQQQAQAGMFPWTGGNEMARNIKPAACLSFQYSRKVRASVLGNPSNE